MNRMNTSRRSAVMGMTAAALFGASLADAQEATPIPADKIEGVAGGGTLQGMGDTVVTFALGIVSPPEGRVQGVFILDDASDTIPVRIESLRFDVLEPLSEKSPDSRRIVGWATLNGAGEYPFLLQILLEDAHPELNLVLGVDAEPFISAAEVKTCDCGGFSYGLRSMVVTGDVVRFGAS